MLLRNSSLLIAVALLVTGPLRAAEPTAPHEIIESAAGAIAAELKDRKDYLSENRAELYALINEILVPHFDIRLAGRLVLGNHWTSASSEQRDRFIDAFYEFLLQSYANGVLQFEEDAITVYPVLNFSATCPELWVVRS